jgi:hypothetical protein
LPAGFCQSLGVQKEEGLKEKHVIIPIIFCGVHFVVLRAGSSGAVVQADWKAVLSVRQQIASWHGRLFAEFILI